MTDAEIERLASEYIAEDWTPDRYYRDMNIIAFASKLLEHGYAAGRKDEREQVLEEMRVARETLQAAIARLDNDTSGCQQYRCVKCGYKGPLQIGHQRPNGTGECGYIAARAVNVGE